MAFHMDNKAEISRIEDINIEGVGRITLKKLVNAGYSIELLVTLPPQVIAREAKINVKKAILISEYVRKAYFGEVKNFVTAKELMDRRKNVLRISTGSNTLDELFLGGVETQAVTELVGEFGSGKTQLCHQLAVMVQLPVEEGGLEGKAIYVDTEGTFRPERIIQIAEYRGLDPRKALRNINYGRARSLGELLAMLSEVETLARKGFKLLVVDTVASIYRVEGVDRVGRILALRKLAFFASELARIAVKHGLAVVVANQIVSVPGRGQRPAGGVFLEAYVGSVVELRRLRGRLRMARVIRCRNPILEGASCRLQISDVGVLDV